MKTWAEHTKEVNEDLERDAAARRKRREEERQPLRIKLEKVAAELPPGRAAAGLPLQFFVEQTTPRWKGKHANARDIGIALRAMGWTRIRRWRADLGGFRAHWYPPAGAEGPSLDHDRLKAARGGDSPQPSAPERPDTPIDDDSLAYPFRA